MTATSSWCFLLWWWVHGGIGITSVTEKGKPFAARSEDLIGARMAKLRLGNNPLSWRQDCFNIYGTSSLWSNLWSTVFECSMADIVINDEVVSHSGPILVPKHNVSLILTFGCNVACVMFSQAWISTCIHLGVSHIQDRHRPRRRNIWMVKSANDGSRLWQARRWKTPIINWLHSSIMFVLPCCLRPPLPDGNHRASRMQDALTCAGCWYAQNATTDASYDHGYEIWLELLPGQLLWESWAIFATILQTVGPATGFVLSMPPEVKVSGLS